ncbi:hypothetical protein Ancab_003599 [Ancistrocladus abbreviatus]
MQCTVAEVDGDDGNVTDVDWKWWLLDLRWILNGLGVRASSSLKLESDESPSNESRPTPSLNSSLENPTPPSSSVEYSPAFSSAGKIRSGKCKFPYQEIFICIMVSACRSMVISS